jgi:hypothetical protein
MQTNLAPQYIGTPEGEQAEAILRKCLKVPRPRAPPSNTWTAA